MYIILAGSRVLKADIANREASVPVVVLWWQLHLCSLCFTRKLTVTTQVFLLQ
jgi:hypothetical protein